MPAGDPAATAVGCHRRRGGSRLHRRRVSGRRESGEVMDLDHLKTLPLFSSLSDKALRTVAVFASETSVSAGKLLVHEGDYSYDLIVIDTGTADVIKDGETIGS